MFSLPLRIGFEAETFMDCLRAWSYLGDNLNLIVSMAVFEAEQHSSCLVGEMTFGLSFERAY